MTFSYTCGREFISQVRPILERHDAAVLVRYLRRHWPNGNLRGLLRCGHDEAVKIALFCLSLTGTMADNRTIARLLHDDDAQTVALAEQALWSIWFRAGDDRGNISLRRAVHLISQSRFDQAIALLNELLSRCPTFAEAYNQRAIACFLAGDYVRAIHNYKQTLRLNRHHFGALAGLGHSYVSLRYLHPALEAYHRTLALHPRLEGIRRSIRQVRECIRRSRTAKQPQSAPS